MLDLPALLQEFAFNARLDTFGGVHAPGNDYADASIASMNCVIATQDFHDFLAEKGVESTYVSFDHPPHVANLLNDTVIDWTLRQFDPFALVPTLEPLSVYCSRFPHLTLLPVAQASVYSKDTPWPYWWTPERRAAFEATHPALAPLSSPWTTTSVAPADVPALKQEWLSSHPGHNLEGNSALDCMNQALAFAASSSSLLAARSRDGALAGLLAYLPANTSPNRHDSFHLVHLGVEPSLQRQGAATALVRSLSRLAARAYKPLTVSLPNPATRRFFLRLGFSYMSWLPTAPGASEPYYQLSARATLALSQS